jgi:glycosyltransferase involved in cell wall biosynthesis
MRNYATMPCRKGDGNLYLLVTSDKVGSSGATVTSYEYQALSALASANSTQADLINPDAQPDPYMTDALALQQYKASNKKYKLAHFYAGTYSKLVEALKNDGTKVTYTAAAHDINESRTEFSSLGYAYNFPHLTDPALFAEYVRGYKEADIVICPSHHSKQVMESYGCKNVTVIPHGTHMPSEVKKIGERFIVGYLGANGPDKGLIYIIKAWASLNYKDSQLVIAGRYPENLVGLVRQFGRGSIYLAGFVESLSTFYNGCSVYVQPSVTEGFGMEVVEAMSYGRPVICSTGVGAVDCIAHGNNGMVFEKRDVKALAECIHHYKTNRDVLIRNGEQARKDAHKYTWDSITPMYQAVWQQLA